MRLSGIQKEVKAGRNVMSGQCLVPPFAVDDVPYLNQTKKIADACAWLAAQGSSGEEVAGPRSSHWMVGPLGVCCAARRVLVGSKKALPGWAVGCTGHSLETS
uniref:Uncharacterized protein n=1 Tax=Arundo donax TaxID=35708 RepID=A0A0A9H9L3_ARUDO